jgi:RNA polymerase sigma factor (sigma-70 family)
VDAKLWAETRELLEAIAELPDRERDAITLSVAGYSWEEIGERLGLAAGSVKQYIWRGRRILRNRFRA